MMNEEIYRFVFRTDKGRTWLDYPPKNWKELKYDLVRDAKYKGIGRKIAATFEFVKDGRKIISDTYADGGVDAFLEAGIYKQIAPGWQSRRYIDTYMGDFDTYENNDTSATINFVDTPFANYIQKRQNKKINLNTLTSIDGDSFTGEINPYKTLKLHDRTIPLLNKHNLYPMEIFVPYTGIGRSFDMDIEYASNKDVGSVTGQRSGLTSPGIYDLPWSAEQIWMLNSNKTVSIDIDAVFNLSLTPPTSSGSLVYWVIQTDSNNKGIKSTRVNSTVLEFTSVNNGVKTDVDINITLTFSVFKGNGLVMGFEIIDTSGDAYVTVKDTSYIKTLNLDRLADAPTDCKVMLPHEVGERLLQIITGEQLPLYAPIFGRTDLGYDSDGELAYKAQTNGKLIRGFPVSYEVDSVTKTTQLNTSFKEWFEAYNAIRPIAAYIDKQLGYYRLVIDAFENVFDNETVGFTFENISELKIKPAKDYYFGSIKCGAKEVEKEEINGLDSPNGSATFEAPVAVDGEYKIESPYVTDDYAIALAQRLRYADNPTTDSRYDKLNFIIDCKKSGTSLIAKRNEDFETVEGIDSPNTSINLDLSPARCLLRHKQIIAVGTYRKKDKSLKFVSGALNDSLVTKRTDESNTVYENQDITISSLDTPIFIPNLISFKTSIEWDDFNYLQNNNNILCKFVEKKKPIYGFIDKMSYNDATGEVEVTLIQSYR